MRRPASEQPATALRAALDSPWPDLQDAARRILRTALRAPTLAEAARILWVGPRTLARIRSDFPEIFQGLEKSGSGSL